MKKRYGSVLHSVILILSFFSLVVGGRVQAATLTLVSDTIEASAPGTSANHIIRFTTTVAVPVSGHIVVTPQAGAFTIPAALDHTDIDLSVNGTPRALAFSAGVGAGSATGVSVTSGTSGSLVFTLNDTDALGAGDTVVIEIGTSASFGGSGVRRITNPAGLGSYRIAIQTQGASTATIDDAFAMIALVSSVEVSTSRTNPPSSPPPPSSGGGGGGGGGGGAAIPNLPPVSVVCIKADVNCDGKVNLVDFSIAAFWYKKSNPPAKVDINGDGVVNLVDFSIMAFYWTK